MSASKVVVLQGYPILNEHGVAAAAIKPGMLVQGVATLTPHSAASGRAARTFALERDEMGDGIATDYAIGDVVKVGSFSPGDVVNAIVASGAVIANGSLLESNGDGTLKVGTTLPVARAVEDHLVGTIRLAAEIY